MPFTYLFIYLFTTIGNDHLRGNHYSRSKPLDRVLTFTQHYLLLLLLCPGDFNEVRRLNEEMAYKISIKGPLNTTMSLS